MSTPGFRLSRRAVLRGLGVSMALPALEIMQPRRALAQAAKPLRFLTVYSPNGFLMNKWKPTATGANFPTPPLLAKLEPFRGRLQHDLRSGQLPGQPQRGVRWLAHPRLRRDADPDAGRATGRWA